jgi:hypothetical protein
MPTANTLPPLDGAESRSLERFVTEPDHRADRDSNHLYLKDIKTFLNLKKAAKNCTERKRQTSLRQDQGK